MLLELEKSIAPPSATDRKTNPDDRPKSRRSTIDRPQVSHQIIRSSLNSFWIAIGLWVGQSKLQKLTNGCGTGILLMRHC